jgi:hypothetical protein
MGKKVLVDDTAQSRAYRSLLELAVNEMETMANSLRRGELPVRYYEDHSKIGDLLDSAAKLRAVKK